VTLTSTRQRTAIGPSDEHPWVLLTGGSETDVEPTVAPWRDLCAEPVICPGPDNGHTCPLVAGDACPVVAGAAVVLNGLGSGSPHADLLLAALAVHHPEVPVVDVAFR
jgi:hypothetical protein